MVQVVESFSNFQTLIASEKLTVIDFWATWCGPCKVISPVFEKLSKTPEFADVVFAKCDVEEQEEVAAEVGIKAMPTFIFFKGGEKVGSVMGADPNKLKAALEGHVANL